MGYKVHTKLLQTETARLGHHVSAARAYRRTSFNTALSQDKRNYALMMAEHHERMTDIQRQLITELKCLIQQASSAPTTEPSPRNATSADTDQDSHDQSDQKKNPTYNS